MTSPHGRHGYPVGAGSRDLRFDFMRGFAMLSVVAAHLEMFSWFNFLFWERLGLISSAGMFIVTAGLVLGLVNRKVVEREGMAVATERLLRRSFVLWRALVAAIILILLIRAVGLLDMTAVTTFTERWAGQTYPMVPDPETPWHTQLALIASMRVSPHQIQILGLYVFLYFAGWLRPVDTPLMGMQWEFAFPPMIRQAYFMNALAVGFFRQEIADWLAVGMRRRIVIGLSLGLYLGYFLLAQMTSNLSFPAWSRLDLISGERFDAIYNTYFAKKNPSLFRLLNMAVFFVCFYALLTYLWQPINKVLGWLLIPLGEASLYVFLMHLVFVAAIDQIPGYFDVIPAWDQVWPTRIWINTALYVGTILGLWLLVRHKVLFGIVPR